jgi:flavin-dependent dehydrogenase
VPGGLTNVCLVVPGQNSRSHFGATGSDLPFAKPADALQQVVNADAELAARFADARMVASPVMLGPMAVDTSAAGEPGLLLAGDAAGFIDPMTGDGLRLALLGAEIAAGVVKGVLNGAIPIDRAHLELADRRRQTFQAKWRFNRTLRSLVSSPASVTAAAVTARLMPAIFARMIQYAGDCGATEGHAWQ